jgi:S-DNA-T family DNA segregation ATPase FtsK/SpoIIIE
MNSAYGNTWLARKLLSAALYVNVLALALSVCAGCVMAAANEGIGGLPVIWLLLLAADAVVVWYAVSQGAIFELRVERRWKHVCSHIGFEGEARSFKNGLKGAYIDGETKTIHPQLRDVRGNWEAWTGTVRFFAGQTLEEYQKQADAFKYEFHVPFVTFELDDSGLFRVRAGQMQVPEKYGYSDHSNAVPAVAVPRQIAAAPTISLNDILQTFDERATLQAVPMARDTSGRPWTMPIEGNHLLVAGRTGSGKGSWIWSLVFGVAKARRAGLVRLWGLDPKKVELGYGMEWWDEYADTVEGMIELLEKAVSELLERNAQLQGKARKITPSRETPVNVIIIDELAYLSAMVPDKKLQQRADTAIRTILILGRATGYSLVGASQDPRKEILGFRDYFPTRVALGMPAPMVDLVLGEKMHDAGAYCEQIPLRDAGAGCAYVLEEMSAKPKLVRAAWCSDDDIRRLLGGSPPSLQLTDGVDEDGETDWLGRPVDDNPPIV